MIATSFTARNVGPDLASVMTGGRYGGNYVREYKTYRIKY